MKSFEQNLDGDETIHIVSTNGLPEAEAEKAFEEELNKHDVLEQMFGDVSHKDRSEEIVSKGRADAWGNGEKGARKIKTPKSKIQQDTEITRAQRQSPKNQ